jgi:TolB-like protein
VRRATIVASILALAGAAQAAERPTVAVLYFDNNSPLREYDVLQKGLADMLVTDLSQIEGLQVVERDKLQKLLEELKLQRSKFFDPATAQKLGRGIGARYAVTGALAAFDPKMRIDVRVIEVATAKVVVADRVIGDRQKVFDLEAELVAKLAAGLQVRVAGVPPRAGVGDVATLLQYSQGIDAADKGDLQAASRRLAEVVRTAPDFQLAKDKYTDVVRRLRQAGQRRQDVMSVAEAELVRSLDGHLVGDVKDREALGRQLGYRIARGNYQLWKLAALVAPYHSSSGPAIAPPDRQAELQERSRAYFENTMALLNMLRANRDPQGRSYPDARIEAGDRSRAESLGWKGIDQWSFVSPASAALGLARFTVHGEAPFWGPVSLAVRPALVDLDRGYGPKALALIVEAEKELKAAVDRHEEKVDALIDAIDAHAEILVALGRKEEAIAQWQRVLDGYPTATKYKELEKKIEDLLAMSPEATQFAAAVKSCSNELWTLMPGAMSRARRADGRKGVRKQMDQVTAACRGGTMTIGFLASAWQFGVQEALKAGDCDFYREIKAEAAKQTATLGPNLVDGLTRTAGNACGEHLAELNR